MAENTFDPPAALDFGSHETTNGSSSPSWRSEFEPSVAGAQMGIAEEAQPISSDSWGNIADPVAFEETPPEPLIAPRSVYDAGPPPNGHTAVASAPPPDGPSGPELGLMDHLNELRVRLMRSFVYLGVAMTFTWIYCIPITNWFNRPIVEAMHRWGTEKSILTLNGPMEGFMLFFSISMWAGILFAAPLMIYEMWAFIEPALTRHERRFTVILVPFSILLFLGGCGFGYCLSIYFYKFFLQYRPAGAAEFFRVSDTVIFQLRILLLFGVCFQVPVVSIFLNKIGLMSREWMIKYWRHVMVGIVTVVSLATPTWDPITLLICSVPPCLLYLLSIWITKWL